MAVLTYSGTFGGNRAGTSGLTTTLTASGSLPSGASISEIQYSLRVSAYPYDSGVYWQLWFLNISGGTSISGSPYASSPMRSPNDEDITFSGQMPVSGASAFSSSSISVTAKANCTGSPISYMWEVSITVIYENVPAASTGSFVDSSIDAGTNITLNISNSRLSEVSHKVLWSIGSYSYEQTVSLGVSSATYTIPLEWLNAMTSSQYGTATAKLTTYYGSSSMGYNTYSFTIIAGATIVPSISSFTATRVDYLTPSGWGIYVQHKSKVQLQTSASSVYGATIVSYAITGDGQTGSSNDYTTAVLNGSGTVTFYVTVTDTRGKTAQTSVSITVYAYSAPTVTSYETVRCDSGGTEQIDGTYAKSRGTTSISSCDGNNSVVSFAIYYKLASASSYTTVEASASSATWYVYGAGAILSNVSYNIKYVIEDAFGTTEIVETMASAAFIIFLRNGGDGIAFGKGTCAADTVEVNTDWDFKAGPIYSNGTRLYPPLTFTATLLASGWSSGPPYTQTVSVTNMLSTYNPKTDLVQSSTTATAITQIDNWLFVLNGNISTANGSITAKCNEDVPTVDLNIIMLVVR